MSNYKKKNEQRNAKFYSKMVAEAVKLGVPMDDIIFETEKYHGVEFANRIESSIVLDW